MEQFSLEKYLENPSRKIVTREGKPVRIICTDVKGASYSVLALVDKGDYEGPTLYTKKGEYNLGTECSYDLFFAPKKQEGWINISKGIFNDNLRLLGHTCIFKTKEGAEEAGKGVSGYITTIKIEWEE